MPAGNSPADVAAVPDAFAATATSTASLVTTTPSQEFDMHLMSSLFGANAATSVAKKTPASLLAPTSAASAAAPMTSSMSTASAALSAPFRFDAGIGMDVDSMFNVDFASSFLTSKEQQQKKSQQDGEEEEEDEEEAALDDLSMDSSEEWYEDFGFDDQSLSLGGGGAGSTHPTLSATSSSAAGTKRKPVMPSDGGTSSDDSKSSKRSRNRPTVQTIRQRQQVQLDKLNARNQELRATITSVTSDLDQVKRLVCRLLKKRLSEKLF